jgi:type I restriction enzyme R subunit
MTSRNFGFLAPEYAILATLGANAEALARQDPTSALVKLRQFGEQLTIAIAASGGIQVDSRDKQVDLIKTLGTRLGIPRSLQQHLHELRRSGNSAVHDLEGSTDDVSRLLPTAFSLGRWFRVKFAPHLSAPPEEYVPVEALADASKDLHAQLQELQRLVQERPAQIATESLSEIRA